jgi:hypothetical protein
MNGPAAAHFPARGAAWLRLVVLALMLGAPALARADDTVLEDGARFEVRSAFLEPVEHVYQLNATLDLALSRNARQAIREGVPVVLQVDVDVVRKRRYFLDEKVASLVQRWQLRYHALSERYIVNNINSGQQLSYTSLAAALNALSEVRGLPVIDEALLGRSSHDEASLRVQTTIEGGLPAALKAMMFWMDWKRSTDWYTWTLPP